jgi:hypothetical protein
MRNNEELKLMATISAAEVKKLRDATGAGMMDCKRALTKLTAISIRQSNSCE